MWQDIAGYFLAPEAIGYTVSKTFVYAIVLILAVYFIFELLKKLKIKIDRKLAVGTSPFVVFGGMARVLEDSGIVSSYWLVTPGIYISIFFLTFSALLISLLVERKKNIPYYKTMFGIGIFFTAISLLYINIVNYYGAFLVLLFLLPWILIFRFVKWDLANRLVTLTQMFDATTTYVAIKYFGYFEQHVVPTYFINLFGPVSFIPLKLIGIVVALILIDKLSEDRQFSNWLKLCIAILGGATGTRDFVRLIGLT